MIKFIAYIIAIRTLKHQEEISKTRHSILDNFSGDCTFQSSSLIFSVSIYWWIFLSKKAQLNRRMVDIIGIFEDGKMVLYVKQACWSSKALRWYLHQRSLNKLSNLNIFLGFSVIEYCVKSIHWKLRLKKSLICCWYRDRNLKVLTNPIRRVKMIGWKNICDDEQPYFLIR